MQPPPSPPADPEWLAHRFDPERDAIHYRHVTRAEHRAITFLTDDELPDSPPIAVPRQRALAEAGPAAPLHFVFHSAFCCSTLLARAFDIEGIATSLKEPVILNDVLGWRQRGAPNAKVAQALDAALTLLANPFASGEAVIVKPSNVVNTFVPLILALRPGTRALLLYTSLPNYLNSIARKGMWGRRWVRDLLVKQFKDGLIDLGFTSENYLELTDLQVAAVGWLAQQALFARVIAQHGPSRVRSLDSETLVARPLDSLAALGMHFGLNIASSIVEEVAEGPIFSRHSKFGEAFDASDRAAAQRDSAALHADEIEKVIIWAGAVADTAVLRLDLDAKLLA